MNRFDYIFIGLMYAATVNALVIYDYYKGTSGFRSLRNLLVFCGLTSIAGAVFAAAFWAIR